MRANVTIMNINEPSPWARYYAKHFVCVRPFFSYSYLLR